MRGTHRRIGVLVLLCVVVTACSARSGASSTRSNTNVITTAEVDGSGHQDAFTLVQSLRPQWLRVRGTSSIAVREVVRIYLDGSMLGGPDHLRQISTHSISSLRYMDGLQATQRWGLDHGAGAIVVTTRGRTTGEPPCCD